MIEWEMFLDESYYGMWAVRPVKDKRFDSPLLFHFRTQLVAKEFLRLVKVAHVSLPMGE